MSMRTKTKSFINIIGGAIIGALSGFFGGGGGMLCVPLLELTGLETKKAHATAIAVILPVCVVSAAVYIFNGYFSYRECLAAVLGVVLGGIIGAYALKSLNSFSVALIFALLMAAVGIKLVIG